MSKGVKNTKKNHFNPRGHLKGFANNKGILYRYRKDNSKFEYKEYPGWGYKINFYPQSLEDLLEKFDSDLPRIVKNLEEFLLYDNKGKPLNIEEIHSLARFIVFQLTRISKFKAQLDENSETAKNKSELYRNVPELRAMYDSLYTGDMWFEEMVVDINNKMVDEILKHSWVILIAEEGSEFILGDKGLATGTRNLTDNQKSVGLGSPDTLKWFPLSKRLCLLITSDNSGWYSNKDGVNGIPTLTYTKEQVEHINGLIALCADEYIYASSSELIKEALVEANRIKKKTNNALKKKGLSPIF